jgi:hypothetical protein
VTDLLYEIGRGTGIHVLMNSPWGWPTVESLHFMGLSLLVGAVGLFDLRMLGLARGIPIAALHRLIPWGVGGYVLNAVTGVLFVTSAPDQYLFNPAFQIKLGLMAVAGCNVLVFYRSAFARVREGGSDAHAPRSAKVAAIVSLASWTGVIVCGRLITYYRPPYDWCWWC